MNSSIITTMASISLVRVARDVRIVGGVPALPGEFPHHVAITYNDVFICGGSIISPMMILTAAHCIFTSFIPNPQISLLKVIAGLHNITDVDVNEQIRNVNIIYKHDGFNPQTLVHDIAILVLNEPLRYTATIKNINLPNPNQEVGAYYATLSGWGTTNRTELGSVHLRKVNVPIVSHLTCQNRYRGAYEITEGMVCMGGTGVDSCQGDSGGAAVCAQGDSSIVQCAIVSFGRGCGEADTPGVYTRVSNYVDWISHIERKVFCFGEPSNNAAFYQGQNNIIATTLPRNCEDILKAAQRKNQLQYAPSGVYKIYFADEDMRVKEANVFCDMETENGGWLVIQRRSEFDTQTDFYRSWNNYATGFGKPDKSHWLGLDVISILTNSDHYELRIDLMDMEGEERFAKYVVFRIANSENLYRLHIEGYSGDAGDSMAHHNGLPFSTKDRDSDNSTANCAIVCHGAWWYKACHTANFNGLYGSTTSGPAVSWHYWKGDNYSMKRTEMKIRTIDYDPIIF